MIHQFLNKHNALSEQIDAPQCLADALKAMERGLSGEGNIPMIPSYLTTDIAVEANGKCVVVDAGGTNVRTALAAFDDNGCCRLENFKKSCMPGTRGELSYEEFYAALADPVRQLGETRRVGLCFSYNVTLDRTLDGCLDFWCKEVQVPDAVGKPVGASLKRALGTDCESIHVLNDSVAAMLGAEDVQVGVILGTGVNVCYLEQCRNIPKISADLKSDNVIISTEIGEFDGIPQSDFERQVIASSDAPGSAWGEKQCAGGYLGDVIRAAWRAAALEGILPGSFGNIQWGLSEISRFLSGEKVDQIPRSQQAVQMAQLLVARAAKIAAILCAGPIIRAGQPGQRLRVAVEGSQFWKLTGFRGHFCRELDGLLTPHERFYEVVQAENACLIGAARAAFAKQM